MSAVIAGVCPIVAVPFLGDGSVDGESFERLVDHLLGEDVGALTLFGLASEFYKLTEAERVDLMVRFLARTSVAGGVNGVVSVTDHSAEVAVIRAREAEAGGADAINVLPPHFLGPSAGAVIAHLDAVLGAVEIPVIVQYAPAQTGSRIEPATLAALAERHPNFSAVKVEALPPGKWVARLLSETGGALDAAVGYAGVQMLDAFDRGAVGVQPGCSFVPIYSEITRLLQSGDRGAAAALHGELLPYIAYWMQGVELIIQAEKTVLWRRGLISTEYCRAPGYDLDATERVVIEEFLERFDSLLGH